MVARVGQRTQITVKVIDATNGTSISVRTGKASSDEELADLTVRFGQEMRAEVLSHYGMAASVTIRSSGAGVRRWWWLPAVAGVAVAAAGLALLFVSRSTAAPLTDGQHHDLSVAQAARDGATTQQTLGVIGICVGAAALAAAAGLLVFGGGDDAPRVSAWTTGGAGGLAFWGALP